MSIISKFARNLRAHGLAPNTITSYKYSLRLYLSKYSPTPDIDSLLSFKVRKTWVDSIDTNTTQYFRIAGLSRGRHKLKLLKTSSGESKVKYVSIYK